MNTKKTFSANTILSIDDSESILKSLDPMVTGTASQSWVKENTAMLIFHGIGNQNPLETLDGFGRGLIETYWKELGYLREDFTITHEVAVKAGSTGRKWFDNYIRISKKGEDSHIDLYEYYWAYLTQGKISMREIQKWVRDVVRQANIFYEENVTMEGNAAETKFIKKAEEKDPVTKKSRVRFTGLRYKIFLMLVSIVLPLINWILGLPRWIAKKSVVSSLGLSIPAAKLSEWLEDTLSTKMANVIGDIVIYNIADEKCSLYEVRKNILAGAVDATRYLIEPQESGERSYGKVLLVGHSLGTQIAYDAINRINHLINFKEIKGVAKDGVLLDKENRATDKHVSGLLYGLVTFGSPLDKIAFFLREHVQRENILMLQIINDYHSFRQRDWYNIDELQHEIPMAKTIDRLFENIPWRNYFDKRDYVSGPLDFYDDVINVDCDYANNIIKKKDGGKTKEMKSSFFSFTHSWYWDNPAMFKDIIGNFLQ